MSAHVYLDPPACARCGGEVGRDVGRECPAWASQMRAELARVGVVPERVLATRLLPPTTVVELVAMCDPAPPCPAVAGLKALEVLT